MYQWILYVWSFKWYSSKFNICHLEWSTQARLIDKFINYNIQIPRILVIFYGMIYIYLSHFNAYVFHRARLETTYCTTISTLPTFKSHYYQQFYKKRTQPLKVRKYFISNFIYNTLSDNPIPVVSEEMRHVIKVVKKV